MRSWWLISLLHVSLISRGKSQLFGNSPRVPFICKIRKVDCNVRPESVCCVFQANEKIDTIEDDQEEKDLVFGDEQDPSYDGDNLIKIASNIHEVVVRPNGEPIQDIIEEETDEETSGHSEITEELTSQESSTAAEVLGVAFTTTTTTSPTTTTPAPGKIPSFCLKLKFNCKLFSSHKCCRYKAEGDSSSSAFFVGVTKDKPKKSQVQDSPVVIGIKQSNEDTAEREAVEEPVPTIPEAPKKERKKSFFSSKYGKSKYSFNKRKPKYVEREKIEKTHV